MKLVRFTQRSFINGSIVEAGDSILLHDDFPMSLHMIDVRKESEARDAGKEYQPEGIERNSIAAVFRADLANDIVASGYMHGRTMSGQVDPAAAPATDVPAVPTPKDDSELNIA